MDMFVGLIGRHSGSRLTYQKSVRSNLIISRKTSPSVV